MKPPRGDGHEGRVGNGNVDLTVAVVSPRDDRTVGLDGKTVSLTCGDGDESSIGPRNIGLTRVVMKPVLLSGTIDWPKSGKSPVSVSPAPHATMEPSDLRPRLWWSPAAMAMKSELGDGTVASISQWHEKKSQANASHPHATMEPSDLRPRLCHGPAATAMKPVLGSGTVASVSQVHGDTSSQASIPHPHAVIEPSDLRPRLWYTPAATAMKSVLGAGTLVPPNALYPHAAREPSDLRPTL